MPSSIDGTVHRPVERCVGCGEVLEGLALFGRNAEGRQGYFCRRCAANLVL